MNVIHQQKLFRWILCLFLLPVVVVDGLSSQSPADVAERGFIQLTNPIDTSSQQQLPASFVQGWPTWILHQDGVFSKIPDDEGFVQPASIDQLWQPVDLIRPKVRLALGLHIRQGIIRHVMPAVDVSYVGGTHRNRGICSVPRAYAWMDFTNSIDEWDKYHLVLSSRKNEQDEWTTLTEVAHSSGVIGNAVERALMNLAESPPDEFADGSHIVHVLLHHENEKNDEECTEPGATASIDDVDCPKTGHELRVTMDDDDYIDGAPGVLQVAVRASMAGSDSDYLPDAYKALYEDESLRNPLYAKFKAKQANKRDDK